MRDEELLNCSVRVYSSYGAYALLCDEDGEPSPSPRRQERYGDGRTWTNQRGPWYYCASLLAFGVRTSERDLAFTFNLAITTRQPHRRDGLVAAIRLR